MSHPTEEQLIEAYYGAPSPVFHSHIEACAECAAEYLNLSETLNALADDTLPQRRSSYGAQVWSRLAPQLRSKRRVPKFLAIAAAAALLAVAFFAGMWTERRHPQPTVLQPKPIVFQQAPAPAAFPTNGPLEFTALTVGSSQTLSEQDRALAEMYRADSNAEVRRAVLKSLVKQQNVRVLSNLAKRETDRRWQTDIQRCLYQLQTLAPENVP